MQKCIAYIEFSQIASLHYHSKRNSVCFHEIVWFPNQRLRIHEIRNQQKKLFISDKNIYNVCLKVSLHHTSHTRHRTSVRNAIWADESTFIPHICSSLSHYQCLRSVWASVWQFLLWMRLCADRYFYTHMAASVCALEYTCCLLRHNQSTISKNIRVVGSFTVFN